VLGEPAIAKREDKSAASLAASAGSNGLECQRTPNWAVPREQGENACRRRHEYTVASLRFASGTAPASSIGWVYEERAVADELSDTAALSPAGSGRIGRSPNSPMPLSEISVRAHRLDSDSRAEAILRDRRLRPAR